MWNTSRFMCDALRRRMSLLAVARELNVFQGGRRRFKGRNTTERLGQSGHGNKNNLTEFTLCLSGFHRVIYSVLYWHWLSFCSTCGLLKLKCLQAAWAEPTFRFGRLGLDKHPLILDGEKNKSTARSLFYSDCERASKFYIHI